MARVEDNGGEAASAGEVRGPLEEDAVPGGRTGGTGREIPAWRRVLVWLLVTLGSLCALFGVFAVWIRAVTLNTNTFTNTVGPLIKDEQVSKAVSNEAISILFKQADVAEAVRGMLPSGWDFATEPITGGLEALAERATREIIKTDQFQLVWRNALALSHASAVRLIRNEGAFRTTGRGEVVLDLGELLDSIRAGLADRGVTALKKVEVPERAGEIVVYRSDQLRRARQGVRTLDTLNWALPLAAFALFALAVAVPGDRRKALLLDGAGLAAAMALALVILNVGQWYVLDQVRKPEVHDAANVIWNSVWGGFVVLTVALLLLGVLVVAGAVLAGPRPWAVRLRSRLSGFFNRRAPGARG